MRIRIAGALAALVIALPLGAQSAADLAGSWTFEQETPRGTLLHTVTFAQEDEGWAGTMATERRSFDLEEVTFDDGRVTFSFQMGPPPGRGGQGPPQGQTRPQSGEGDGTPRGESDERPSAFFQGVLDGDRITGEMEGPRGSHALVLTRARGQT